MQIEPIPLIIGVIFILISVIGIIVIKFTFKNVFCAKRKTREEAFELLETRGVYNREHYETLVFEEVKAISDDGYMLKGQYINQFPEGKDVVIFVHGYTANHLMGLQFVEMYKEMGFNLLMIDTRSHGESGAMYPTYGIKEQHDLRKWVLALREKLGNDIRIGLHGQSMGAAATLMYAGCYNDIEFVVSDCAFSSAEEVLQYQFRSIAHMPSKPLYGVIRKLAEKKIGITLEDSNPEKSIAQSEVPVLFIHGTADKTIPSQMSEKMYKNRGNSKDHLILVEGAIHVESYRVDKEKYREEIRHFIKSIREENHDL